MVFRLAVLLLYNVTNNGINKILIMNRKLLPNNHRRSSTQDDVGIPNLHVYSSHSISNIFFVFIKL